MRCGGGVLSVCWHAETRPRPSPEQLERVAGRMGVNAASLAEPPTAASLGTVVETLTDMRERDRSAGLSPILVQGYKRSYETSMDQALTYEQALPR